MKKEKSIYLKQMDRFLSYLKNLSENEESLLESNDAIIQFELVRKNNNIKELVEIKPVDLNIKGLIEHLSTLNNRDEGLNYLEKLSLNRKALEGIIRAIDLPYNKKDKIDRLKEKIIESTIGFRLRSEAIQHTD